MPHLHETKQKGFPQNSPRSVKKLVFKYNIIFQKVILLDFTLKHILSVLRLFIENKNAEEMLNFSNISIGLFRTYT